ncbi:FAD:protein FMN transferase [Microbacterium sp. RURRCA19A]|uniref:FAD:protein FMN transferase n=1 Tax=Microbacterium sp. RURRCA19A TaxID=1907391 RepID=UPI00095493B8|nr:FAD:protein FMN transferase [Microbacterium sp. RURRCA19A]SIR61523.1 thiamine biosynthesis lipoprotein [Microbacterium sp. RURRCA19A]
MSAVPAVTVVEPVMGTMVTVQVRGSATTAAAVRPRIDAAIAAVVARMQDDERVFSTYRPDSDVSLLRDGLRGLDDVDPRVREVEALCRRFRDDTAGVFDAWWRGWFDPTGVVKGWSVDAASALLLDVLALPGVEAAAVNAGGDMRLLRAPGSAHVWNVGVADPEDAAGVLSTIALADGAVATSGTAERGAHLIDPRSVRPVPGLVSATVVADTLTVADVWATVAAVSGIDDLDAVRSAPVTSGIVWADGRVRRWAGGIEIARFESLVDPSARAGETQQEHRSLR